jgi:hypothetical protein
MEVPTFSYKLLPDGKHEKEVAIKPVEPQVLADAVEIVVNANPAVVVVGVALNGEVVYVAPHPEIGNG